MWASTTSDPFVVSPGSTHANAPIEVDLYAQGTDEFQWMLSADNLYFGSTNGEYAILTEGESLTPTNFVFQNIGTIGGSRVPPVLHNSSVYFVGNNKRRIYRSQFDFGRDGFVTEELTLLNPEIIDANIRTLCLRQPSDVDAATRLYILQDDGKARSLSVQENNNIIALARNEWDMTGVACSITSLIEDAFVFLYDAAEDSDKSPIRLFSLGGFEQYFGVCDAPWASSVSSGTAPLPHFLENKALAVWDQNDEYIGTLNAGSELDLTDYPSVTSVTVALPVSNGITPLPVHGSDGQGELTNRKQRVPRVAVHVRDTNDVAYNGSELLPADPNKTPKFRSGTFRQWFLGWGFRDEDVIQSNGLYKATLLSLTREIKA